MRRVLTVRFDVTGLSEEQVQSLTLNVCVQAEAYDEGSEEVNYPDVPVLDFTVTFDS